MKVVYVYISMYSDSELYLFSDWIDWNWTAVVIDVCIKREGREANVCVLHVPGHPLADEALEVTHGVAELSLLLARHSPPPVRQHLLQQLVGHQLTRISAVGSLVTEEGFVFLIIVMDGENILGHLLGRVEVLDQDGGVLVWKEVLHIISPEVYRDGPHRESPPELLRDVVITHRILCCYHKLILGQQTEVLRVLKLLTPHDTLGQSFVIQTLPVGVHLDVHHELRDPVVPHGGSVTAGLNVGYWCQA